ncbi:response regulator transcription factor [Paraburkholderia panacisoli]|uniref:Response regulator transcription factor n=1 Tax=Paraburkholderia panacisoli TaxID=2603818 RepID=A0A5B0GQW3_9BURK|nr:response regulator transcription factor [Paraburkholderia panacisoli]
MPRSECSSASTRSASLFRCAAAIVASEASNDARNTCRTSSGNASPPKGSLPASSVCGVSAVHAVYVGATCFRSTSRAREDALPEAPLSADTRARTLSPREMEVIRLLVSGMSINEIAERLHRTKQTISAQKTHEGAVPSSKTRAHGSMPQRKIGAYAQMPFS